jgi:hypothetical protein
LVGFANGFAAENNGGFANEVGGARGQKQKNLSVTGGSMRKEAKLMGWKRKSHSLLRGKGVEKRSFQQ